MAVADNPYDDEKNDVILLLDVSSQSRGFPQPRHYPVPIITTGHVCRRCSERPKPCLILQQALLLGAGIALVETLVI